MARRRTTTKKTTEERPVLAHEEIVDVNLSDEVSDSFMQYSLSVIKSRALPDVRDGLKPVHRRILWTMHELKLRPSSNFVKSARVSGTAIGAYHPHGDSSVYDALVRLIQDFNMNTPLASGHGNFGSLADPSPAAARYCLVGDALVNTDKGTFKIKDLVGDAQPDSTTTIDLQVLGKLRELVHASKFFHSGQHPTIKVTTKEGYSTTGTKNHPILTLVEKNGLPTLEWKLLENISPTDIVAISRADKTTLDFASISQYEEDLAILAGAWVAEGWASDKRAGFNNTDKYYFDAVEEAYKRSVSTNFYSYHRLLKSGKTIWEMDIQGLSQFKDFNDSPLKEFKNQKARQKRIPNFIWQGSLLAKKLFLQFAFEGDGSVYGAADGSTKVSYSTYSKGLAADIQKLLLEFGIVSKQEFASNKGEYKVILSGIERVDDFYNLVGFASVKQELLKARLREISHKIPLVQDFVPFLAKHLRANNPGPKNYILQKLNCDRYSRLEHRWDDLSQCITNKDDLALVASFVDSHYYFTTIKSVEDAGIQNVYSIRVDTEDHAFIADGFINHNTETKLSQAGYELLGELDEDTVDFSVTFTNEHQEPNVLPARFPNLLVNGSQGIAVGLTTSMPAHNLDEVVQAMEWLMAQEDGLNPSRGETSLNPARKEELLQGLLNFIQGPDFPTGASIIGKDGIMEAYRTGQGSLKLRAKYEIIPGAGRKPTEIYFTEIPYTTNPEAIIESISNLIKDKKIEGIGYPADYTDLKTGLRLVVPVKSSVDPHKVIRRLFKATPLESSYKINNVALVNNQPQTLTLLELCQHYLVHRLEIITRRTQYRLRNAEHRAHVLEGLLIALENIDKVVKIIRGAEDTEEARSGLMAKKPKGFGLSEIQANYILEQPLRRLAKLEVARLRDELDLLHIKIKDCKEILEDSPAGETRRRTITLNELKEVNEELALPRRTQILDLVADEEDVPESLDVVAEPTVIRLRSDGTLTKTPEVPAVPSAKAKVQPYVKQLNVQTTSLMKVLTSKGRILNAPLVTIPNTEDLKAKSLALKDLVELEKNESVISVFADTQAPQVLVITRQAVVKQLLTAELLKAKDESPFIILKGDDEVLAALEVTDQDTNLTLVASNSQVLALPVNAVSTQGLKSAGVAGMKLEGSELLAAFLLDPKNNLLTVSDANLAKVTSLAEIPVKGRNGKGIRVQKLKPKASETKLTAAYLITEETVLVDSSSKRLALPAVTKRDAAGTEELDLKAVGLV